MEERMSYKEWLRRNPNKRRNPMIVNIETSGDMVPPTLESELDPNVPYEEIDLDSIPF